MAYEPFKASDEDWQQVEKVASTQRTGSWERMLCELRDRVAALEAAGCAEQGGTPELKPNQAPSSDRCLEEEVLDAMGEGTEAEACKAILAVAKWLRRVGNNGSADELEWEVNK